MARIKHKIEASEIILKQVPLITKNNVLKFE